MSGVDNKFLLYSVILSVTVGICYIRSLECGFVFDDASAIVDNKDLRPRTPISQLFWNDFWGTPMAKEKSHKSYRPLCVLTFRLNYWLSELEPMSYHLGNVILHAVVCLMFMKTCSMFVHELPAFLAALLFAVHPIHTEAVTGVVGRAESLSSIFFLASLMVYSKCTGYRKATSWQPLIMTIGLVTIAMLCKEQGITVIGVCVVYELFVAQRALFKELWAILMGMLRGKFDLPPWLWDSIVRSGVLVGSTVFLLIARIKVMGAQLPVFTNFDNPASVATTPARQMTFNYLLPVNLWLLLFPADLCCDWTMGTIPVLNSILDPRNLVTILFYAVLGKIVIFALSKQARLNRAIIMSLALLVMPFIPASNLFFPVGFVVAERILYAPSMGFCLLVAVGFDALLQHRPSLKSALWFLMGILLVSHAVKTYRRNIEWTSEYTIFRAALTVNQRNAKLWNNVGHALEKQENWAEALDYFNKAVGVQPDDIGAHMNVGRTYKNMKLYKESEMAYEKAKDLFPPVVQGKSYTTRVAPSHLNIFLNLASLYSMDNDRLQEAEKMLKTATDMRPDYIQGYINRGDIYMKWGRRQDALKMYETALKYEPDHADVIYNMGVVNMEMGERQVAGQFFEKAIIADPDHWQSLYNAAVLIQEDKQYARFPVAEERFLNLMKLKPTDGRAPFSLAMLFMDKQDYTAAEKYFKLAIGLVKPSEDGGEVLSTYKSSLFNVALMLTNNMKRPVEAKQYLEELLQHYPEHPKGLMLMGEIAVNALKDLPLAEKSFLAVLKQDPENTEAKHNLCVVYVERGDLLRGEKCLAHSFLAVLKQDPENTEAMHNLCVVYVERGDLLRGEKCLAHVHSLVPDQEYVLQHLNIIRAKIKEYYELQKAGKLPSQQKGQGQPLPPPEGQGQGKTGQDQGQEQKRKGETGSP